MKKHIKQSTKERRLKKVFNAVNDFRKLASLAKGSIFSYPIGFNTVRKLSIESYELAFRPVSDNVRKLVGRKDSHLVLHVYVDSSSIGEEIYLKDKKIHQATRDTYTGKPIQSGLNYLLQKFFKSSTKNFALYAHVETNKNMKEFHLSSGVKSLQYLPKSMNKKHVKLVSIRFDEITLEDLEHLEQNVTLGLFIVKNTFKDGVIAINRLKKVSKRDFIRPIDQRIMNRQTWKGVFVGLAAVTVGVVVKTYYDICLKPELVAKINQYFPDYVELAGFLPL